MSHAHLGVYLNDHLAGSTAALDILAELRRVADFDDWTTKVEVEIRQDRQELEQLMSRADIAESGVRQAAAWVTEKLVELKTRLDDRADGTLHRLELIEALALGIDGKRALWALLQTASASLPALQGLDYGRLIRRAEAQRQAVEVRRLQAGSDALLGS